MDDFCKKFETAIPRLRRLMMAEYQKPHPNMDYRLVWGHFESIALKILIECLKSPPFSIPEADIIQPETKSKYPDLKVVWAGMQYAVDVKSGYSDKKDPWYDMGRLDTYEKEHLRKFKAEYYVTVRWKNRKSPEVVDVYIEPVYKSAAYREKYSGVYYRPYDGKIRPKLWTDFESGRSYFKSKEEFEKGVVTAKLYRWMSLMTNWYGEMDKPQRKKIRQFLDKIDDGKRVDIAKDAKDTGDSDDVPPDLKCVT